MTGNWEIYHNYDPDIWSYTVIIRKDDGFKFERLFKTKRQAKRWVREYTKWMRINKTRSLVDKGKI